MDEEDKPLHIHLVIRRDDTVIVTLDLDAIPGAQPDEHTVSYLRSAPANVAAAVLFAAIDHLVAASREGRPSNMRLS